MSTTTASLSPGPLHGVRVLDVAEPLGAYISRILGDLGADVIKVETPEGDRERQRGPFLIAGQEHWSLYFLHANVNKRSLILDWQERTDQEYFSELVTQSDVVISTEDFETWTSRGMSLHALPSFAPRVVWTAFSTFGLSGPYCHYAGNNFIAEAMGGLMYIQGDDTRPPCVSPYQQGIHLASLHAAFGTLAALWERRTSGRGQLVEVSIQEVLAHIYYAIVRYSHRHEILRRTGTRNPQPANGYYRCSDGEVFICVFQAHHWDRLVAFVDDPWLAHPRFREREARLAEAEAIETCLQAFTQRFKRWELTEALQQHGLPTAPLLTVADVAENPHLTARHFFTEFTQPPIGTVRSPGPLFRTTAYSLGIFRPAPRLGEHQGEHFRADPGATPSPLAAPGRTPRRLLPFEGLRIVDLSRVWAGPYGTRYLADLGAEVIKVESAKFPDGRRPDDAAYAELNRSKHYITLNFQMPEGRELLKRLVAASDVVVENFSPRVMTRYELSYQHLRAIRPELIMVSMPGFGQSGPHSAFVSYGGPLMAYTGMALLWGHPESPIEAHSKIAYPDYVAAGTLALAVTSALHHRALSGEGQYIEIAQVEATATAMEVAFLDYFAHGTVARPCGNRDQQCVPQGCYPCLGHDAWCAISCATEAQWRAFAHLLGGPVLANDPRYATATRRWEQHDALDTLISAWTLRYTPHQAMHILQAHGVPAGAVQSAEDLWRDVHLRARQYIVALQHPEQGAVDHPGSTVRLHGTPGTIQRPLGRLGEANERVFCGLLGLSHQELARFTATGVIG
ncbi:MAG: CaiB/BaiF CoA transferase family protein [Candidatus Tectimicrobiota bacterium]